VFRGEEIGFGLGQGRNNEIVTHSLLLPPLSTKFYDKFWVRN
jgi:hypothetical protein